MKTKNKFYKHKWEVTATIISLLVFCTEEIVRHVAWKTNLEEAKSSVRDHHPQSLTEPLAEPISVTPTKCFNCACHAAKLGAYTQTEKWLVLLFQNAPLQEKEFWFSRAINDPDLMQFWNRLVNGEFGYTSTKLIPADSSDQGTRGN